MKFLTLLALFGTLTRFSGEQVFVQAVATQPPVRARFPRKLLENTFYLHDQDVLDTFEGTKVPVGIGKAIQGDITFSFRPVDGIQKEDFNFDLSLDVKNLGAKSDKLVVYGEVMNKGGLKVKFQAPASVALSYSLVEKFNKDLNYNMKDFQEKAWSLVIDEAKMTSQGGELSKAEKAEVVEVIKNQVNEFKQVIEKVSTDGKLDQVKKFPMDVLLPFAVINQLTHLSENVDITKDHVGLSFSLQKFGLLNAEQLDLLKPIEGSFHTEHSKKGLPLLTQVLIDDNLFSSVLSYFSSSNLMLNVRKIMDYSPILVHYVHKLDTSTVKPVLPDLVEEFGNYKMMNIKVSSSQDKFLEVFPDSKKSVITVDKNGEWKAHLNLVLTIFVEEGEERIFKPVRDLYVTLVATAQIRMDEKDPYGKKFTIAPKNIKLAQVKMIKEDEELEMEQMIIYSMVNLQLSANKKIMYKERSLYLDDILSFLSKIPKELTCFGFDLADIDLTFAKSQAQLTTYYKEVPQERKAFCKDFFKALRDTQDLIWDFSLFAENSFVEGLKEAQQAVKEEQKPQKASTIAHDEL